MSILQEYEGHTKIIGKKKCEALLKYIEGCGISYSGVVYNKDNWEEFDKWYQEVYNNKYGKSAEGDKKV